MSEKIKEKQIESNQEELIEPAVEETAESAPLSLEEQLAAAQAEAAKNLDG